ncbi:MAG: 2-haloalkanoic acid dehalogenase [Candidatus Tectimicrobiota bacterium]|nr:MAG: 2-haloalkanoic acid dehalogenase [Candidatus Tectomicrobia bacterium]
MPPIRAVLFDLGGTLYDYGALAPGDGEALVALLRWAGSHADPETIHRAYRQALKQVFYDYLPRPFYLHRDLFRDAVLATAAALGLTLSEALLARYRGLLRTQQQRAFAWREGARETLAALRARGLRLGIVSNIDDDQLARLAELGDLDREVDFLLSSEQARSCKPDEGIFRQALRLAGCAPQEALFVGDSRLQDVAGANRAGLRSVLLWHRQDREPPAGEPRPHHVIRRLPELLALL